MQATDTPPTAPSPPAAPAPLADWLRLSLTPRVGLLTAHGLLKKFASPGAIFAAAAAGLSDGLNAAQARALAAGATGETAQAVAAELAAIDLWRQHPGRRVLALDHPDYPPALRATPDAPLLLYVQGRAELLARDALAMVGSRNASAQGASNATRLAQALSETGLVIVSGLALGIDAAAHQGALLGEGGTVAVLGTGIDVIYPRRNTALVERIAREGCLVSEYPLGTAPQSSNFPKRNRIISGLARAVLVVEAAAGSGSLITARLALAQGRDVYAIPGSIHATLAKGCHALIKEGARLVESADDILAALAGQPPGVAQAAPDDSFVDPLLAALGDDPATPALLALRRGLDLPAVQHQLLALELAGLVERLPGGMFQRCGR
ncbi:DNA-processing protein DprA [Rugamonas apoptosis]|uniref:DNA-protecting protein DprA n=1 Tax=Rugamonas apoptosis TaxID=2758570 RepID=A0A7W2IL90_9BURK|nr:DNA-processing protein DprA [Rugamonas apoptosis]MBA5688560.1 DNA-protecting protein DprA [Rugamonas apoptosis]